MDKLKDISKKGWKPAGDVKISRDMVKRDTWKSDLKGIASGKKKDPYEESRNNHQSTPLSSLRDPDQFGPPPKHTAYYGDGAASPTRAIESSSHGLGTPVPAARSRQQEHAVEEPPRAPAPYRKDTSGLRTDHLPKPPVRRAMGDPLLPARTSSPSLPLRTASPGLPPRTASPSLPPRQTPPAPVRQASKPAPGLPPRMTEHPDEHTPPPPPPYREATQSTPETGMINQSAVNRLAQAGVSVPGFGMSPQVTTQLSQTRSSAPQLSELQQRFSRMSSSASSTTTEPLIGVSSLVGKRAPPPPPKKSLQQIGTLPQSNGNGAVPPPLPLSSKPRPTG